MVRPARPCNTDNYRHQADVCHAYQVVRAKGIPEDHIIVMAYDDIAQNRQNKFPGKVFNKPTEKGTPGVDVYAGCNINWRGDDVNPKNFMKVLTGDDSPDDDGLVETVDEDVKCGFGHNTTCATRGACCCIEHGFFGCKKFTCCGSGMTCAGTSGCAKPKPGAKRVLKSTSKSKVPLRVECGTSCPLYPLHAPLCLTSLYHMQRFETRFSSIL